MGGWVKEEEMKVRTRRVAAKKKKLKRQFWKHYEGIGDSDSHLSPMNN